MVNGTIRPDIAMLKEVKLLRRFTDAELAAVLQIGTLMAFEAHANIVIEGEPTWGLYLMLEGMVGIYKTNKLTGDIYDVGQLRTGQFFGEMSLIDDNPRSATVRALGACHLFHISKEAFHDLLAQSPEIKLRFYECCIQDLVSRLRELDENYVISQYQLWKVAVTGDAA